jgi:hypothetical protein
MQLVVLAGFSDQGGQLLKKRQTDSTNNRASLKITSVNGGPAWPARRLS